MGETETHIDRGRKAERLYVRDGDTHRKRQKGREIVWERRRHTHTHTHS